MTSTNTPNMVRLITLKIILIFLHSPLKLKLTELSACHKLIDLTENNLKHNDFKLDRLNKAQKCYRVPKQ